MTLILQLPPDVEARLQAEALRNGEDPASVARRLIEAGLPAAKPETMGERILREWEAEGALSSRTDIEGSAASARLLREEAQNRNRE